MSPVTAIFAREQNLYLGKGSVPINIDFFLGLWNRTKYAYDHLGRETQETWKDTPTGSVTHTFTYSYYICGRLQNASDTVGSTANSSYAYTYDYLGRARTITATIANLTPTVTLTQQFDADSNRTQLSAAIGTTNDFINNYQYANDRMTQVKQSGSASGGSNTVDPKRVDISYTNNGQIHTISSYSDLTNSASKLASTATYTYDRASRLTNLSYNLPWVNGTDPAYTLNYDDNGRLHQFTSATDGTTATYAYDHTNQLTGVTGDGTESYAYDNAGNRTGGNYTSTTGNRLTHDADNNLLEYDNEGNRIRKTAANGLTKTEYSYDHRNRLTEVRNFTWTSGAWVQGYTIDYRYDVFDRLVGKTVDVTHDGVIDASAAYIYDGQNMILRFNHSGSGSVTATDLKRRFLNGPAIDQVFAEDAVGTSSTRWLLADQEGSNRDVAEHNYSTGTYTSTMVDHLHYDSYGNFTQTNSAYQPMFVYTGRWYDGESQLYYYRARWYDPKSGRFLSEDPAGFAAGDANLYRYCGNSPVNFTDPSGMYDGGSGGSGGVAGNGWAYNSGKKHSPRVQACIDAEMKRICNDRRLKEADEATSRGVRQRQLEEMARNLRNLAPPMNNENRQEGGGSSQIEPLPVYFVVRTFEPGSKSLYSYLYPVARITSAPTHGFLLLMGNNRDIPTKSFSWHPESWPDGFVDANNERRGRVWADNPSDLKPGDTYLNRILISKDPAVRQKLLNYIEDWISKNGVGYDEGDPRRDPDNRQNEIGKVSHTAPSSIAPYYAMGSQNCFWWANKMLEESHACDCSGGNWFIRSYNVGVGPGFQLPTNQLPKHIEEDAEIRYDNLDRNIRRLYGM